MFFFFLVYRYYTVYFQNKWLVKAALPSSQLFLSPNSQNTLKLLQLYKEKILYFLRGWNVLVGILLNFFKYKTTHEGTLNVSSSPKYKIPC